MGSDMQIQRGVIWHTYTTQSPEYQDAEKFSSDLINTGLFLAILTPHNTFKYLSKNTPSSTKISMRYENNENAVTVEGGDKIHASGVCALTATAFSQCINIRLSERKLFHTSGNNYYENIICCQKPILVKNNDVEFFIHPIIRLYKNGIAHVTFVDTEERNVDLNDFIKNILNLPLKLNSSITTSIEFAKSSLLLDYSGMPLLSRLIAKCSIKKSLKLLNDNSEDLEVGEFKVTGRYIDYTNLMQIQHNLSDIARYVIAIIFDKTKKRTIKDYLLGRNLSEFYNFWQGKPSVYIFEHDNQKNNATDNFQSNKSLVYSLLGKNHLLTNIKHTKKIIDHRAFDDFNFFSEQSLALTILTCKVKKEFFTGTYTEDNLMWDNQVKSDLRDFISFSYDSTIEKIGNEKSHLGLAKIQEDILLFEEWLRIFSRKYGEIQDFTFNTLNSIDIKRARQSVIELIKSRIQVLKLIDADLNDKSNKKITMAFGLIASTSLSPILVKPLFETLNLSLLIKKSGLKSYEDAIYFATSMVLVWLIIKLLNFRRK
ncbi:hypothetical protein OR582_001510 [Escherichia coli]|nr:hypothetical protein [Escherichia coli]